MTNLELAAEKLKAARIVLDSANAYFETAQRLIAESSKLTDEAERLVKGDGHVPHV